MEYGTVYGIELLNANEQLRSEDHGKFVLVNEALNEHAELPFDVTTPLAVREKPPEGDGYWVCALWYFSQQIVLTEQI